MKRETLEESAKNIACTVNKCKAQDARVWLSDFNASLKASECIYPNKVAGFLERENLVNLKKWGVSIELKFIPASPIHFSVFIPFIEECRGFYTKKEKQIKPVIKTIVNQQPAKDNDLITQISALVNGKYKTEEIKALMVENTRLMSEIINNQIAISAIIDNKQ